MLLSNTGAKASAAAVNKGLLAFPEEVCEPRHRGFIRGRSGANNIMELETEAMLAAPEGASDPMLACLDMKSAFPSLAVAWNMAVLGAYGVPEGPLLVCVTLYQGISARLFLCGRLWEAFPIGRGLKQGCPVAGSIFALAKNTVLASIRFVMSPARSLLAAVADDWPCSCMRPASSCLS